MGLFCCKTEDKDEKQIIECENIYKAHSSTQDNYNDILKTRPPCMYGHKCPCPCHSGGKCVYKFYINIKSFNHIAN